LPDIDEKLKRFTEAITSDAAADSQAILEEVRRQQETSLQNATDDSLGQVYRHIKNEAARIRTECGRRVSLKQMENKRTLYARRAELSQEVLREVLEKLAAYVLEPAYAEQLSKTAQEAVDIFGGAPTVISLRHEDMALVPRLRQSVRGLNVSFAEGTFTLGGLTAECPAKHRQINRTLDANFDDWKERFFAEIVIS